MLSFTSFMKSIRLLKSSLSNLDTITIKSITISLSFLPLSLKILPLFKSLIRDIVFSTLI